jgi:hypothetical protein
MPTAVTIDLLSFGAGMVVGIILFIACLPLVLRARGE